MQNTDIIQNYIMRDMSEGVLAIGFDGIIGYVNPSAARILSRSCEELTGRLFAASFFEFEQNDAFNQMILEAVYDRESTHEGIVDYYTGTETRQLHVTTSFLKNGEQPVGIVCVINDVTELSELRDALKAMKKIREMNGKLELRNQLLSETFGRFLSDEIVRQLLETPDGLMLGGKKRVLTVMMSDLRGFTAMSERMDPQKLLDMLNHYLGEMTQIIQAHSGTIIEFIGDGIMAIFGAPAPVEHHAVQAVAAAVEMEAKMAEVNAWNAERGYPALEMGIGIHTGEVIVGNIGSEKRTKYGVVGSNVNLTGRIESYTVGGQILISPQTREAIGGELTVAGEQSVLPKGMDDPMTLSHIVGIGRLSCMQEEQPLLPLQMPISVPYFRIREKHVQAQPDTGRITALSETGAMLQTSQALERFENLQMDIGGKLFAKVLSVNGQEAHLCFTSLPESFAAWYAAVVGLK